MRILAGIAVLAFGAACGTVNTGALQDYPGTTRQELVIERVNPAVLLLETDYAATISVPDIGLNTNATQNLVNQIIAQAVNGQISDDVKTKLDAFAKGISNDPETYFTANAPGQQVNATASFQCTGGIVTPDGYVVTAAHCTNPAADERQKSYVQSGLQPVLDAAVKSLAAELSSAGFDADQTKLLSDAAATYVGNHSQTSNETRTLKAKLFSSSSAGQRQANDATLSLVTQGNAPPKSDGPFGDKDVSILKLDGYTDLPTLPVGSDSDIEAGQNLYVDGFPAAVESGNPSSASTPTVTAGTVTSKKVSDQGVPLLETSATVSGGNSGGPGLDDTGHMVGVVSYGTTSGSYNYLIGASVVQEYLHEKNISARESATTHDYDVALNDFHRAYYKRALTEFQQVKALYPGHPYVDSFIQRTQEAIQGGKDQTPLLDGTALELAIAGGILVVLLLAAAAAGIVILLTRRPGPTPAPAGAMPDVAWHWDGQQWVLVSRSGQPQPPPPGGPPGPPPPGR